MLDFNAKYGEKGFSKEQLETSLVMIMELQQGNSDISKIKLANNTTIPH